MSARPDHETIAAYCDGDDSVDLAAIATYLAKSPSGSREADQIELINRAIRQSAPLEQAPTRLIDWIDQESRPNRLATRMSRRETAIAATVAVGILGVGLYAARPKPTPSMAPTLFDDFSTLLAADEPLDLTSNQLETVADWFESRVPFSLPDLPGLADIGVRGARLCWLLERRVAAIHLDEEGKDGCLYIVDPAGLSLDGETDIPGQATPALLTGSAGSGAFWRDDHLAFGLIASTSTTAIADLKKRLTLAI
ncbi:MAG: hypothetical protein AAGC83_13260 [Pseudomonadota bacterium]